MRVIYIVAVLVGVAALTSCSDSPDAEPGPVQVSTTPAAESATADLPPTATAPEQVVWYGRAYPAAYADCAQRLWDGRVGQWNALSQTARDKVAGGSEAWFKAKGWPVTHEATLLAPATHKVCPA